jgi:hypothetical protein
MAKRRNYSNDPDFETKLKDIVGLYLKPPENAIILCVDEKSRIQILDVLNWKVIGECNPTHNSEDYVQFLKKVDKACEKGKVLHIFADNLFAHKTEAVYDYLEDTPGRFVLRFIPTHSSWLNLVEKWFAEITNKRIRRGVLNLQQNSFKQ